VTSARVASAGDSDPGRGIMNIEQDANLPRPLFQPEVFSKGRCSLARLSGRASFCDYSEST
jgi:hypothetical protein